MGILLGIEESESGRSALTEQDALACFLCQSTGQGVPVGETSEALLQ